MLLKMLTFSGFYIPWGFSWQTNLKINVPSAPDLYAAHATCPSSSEFTNTDWSVPWSEESLITGLDNAAISNCYFQRFTQSTLVFVLLQTCNKEFMGQCQFINHTLSRTELMGTKIYSTLQTSNSSHVNTALQPTSIVTCTISLSV